MGQAVFVERWGLALTCIRVLRAASEMVGSDRRFAIIRQKAGFVCSSRTLMVFIGLPRAEGPQVIEANPAFSFLALVQLV